MGWYLQSWLILLGAAGFVLTSPAFAQERQELVVTKGGEAGAIAAPLGNRTGDAISGRALVTDRRKGLCLLCHSGPFPEERFQGNLAPSLAGAAARLTEGQLRLRIMDSARINPTSLMPAYHRIEGLVRVGQAWRGKPIFTPQEVEDVVAFLKTLQD